MSHSRAARPEIAASLTRLQEGNRRFASGLRCADSLASHAKRQNLAEQGQNPFATILSCADSRVPAEMVFDCGLGDLFVCRVAGNVAGSATIASIEYSAAVLGTPLTAVIGHTRCGVVDAAITIAGGAKLKIDSEHVERLAGLLLPAVDEMKKANPGADVPTLTRLTWAENARLQRREILRQSPTLRKLREAGQWDIVSGVYDISSGHVAFTADTRDPELIGQRAA